MALKRFLKLLKNYLIGNRPTKPFKIENWDNIWEMDDGRSNDDMGLYGIK